MTNETEPSPKNPIPPALIAFVVLYMLICPLMALRQGNSEFLMYAAIMVVLISIVLLLHRAIRFSRLTLWLLAIWGLLHMCGGTIHVDPALTDAYRSAGTPEARPESAVLYSMRLHPALPRYDQIVHAFGFFSATLASYQGLITLLGAPRRAATACAAALMGMGLGAVNEVIEFVAVLTIPETNVGGYINTGWDLVANTIGAVGAAAVAPGLVPPTTTRQ